MFRLLVTLAVLSTPALADPLVRPVRDVAVEYSSTGLMPYGDGRMTIRFAGDGARIRIETGGSSPYVVFDRGAGRMISVVPHDRTYDARPLDAAMLPPFLLAGSSYVKTGTATIAGLDCTGYDAVIAGGNGQICLTDDGVMLRVQSVDHNRIRSMKAVRVTYAPQPAALFHPPPGFQPGVRPPHPAMMDMGPVDPPPNAFWRREGR